MIASALAGIVGSSTSVRTCYSAMSDKRVAWGSHKGKHMNNNKGHYFSMPSSL